MSVGFKLTQGVVSKIFQDFDISVLLMLQKSSRIFKKYKCFTHVPCSLGHTALIPLSKPWTDLNKPTPSEGHDDLMLKVFDFSDFWIRSIKKHEKRYISKCLLDQ